MLIILVLSIYDLGHMIQFTEKGLFIKFKKKKSKLYKIEMDWYKIWWYFQNSKTSIYKNKEYFMSGILLIIEKMESEREMKIREEKTRSSRHVRMNRRSN